MKKLMLVVLTIIFVSLLASCQKGISNVDGKTLIKNGTGGFCEVYIIEKDGYKFAVVMNNHGCGIIQLK